MEQEISQLPATSRFPQPRHLSYHQCCGRAADELIAELCLLFLSLPSKVLLNKKSSGFQTAVSGGLIFLVGDVVPLRGSLTSPLPMLMRRPPGLMRVKRCTRGMIALGCCGIVDPSVAAAIEISEDESNAPAADKEDIDPAVWYESMVMSESVGVGAWAPVASGRAVRSSEPFGLCLGRMVRIEERDEASGVCETGWDRMTVVLYSECTEDVLSRRGRSLSLL